MNLSKNKGITLVALVITIIILLILAGITISQLTGSGLFENAKLAEQKSKEAQEKEDKTLGEYENIINEFQVETITGTRQSNIIKVSGTTSATASQWIKVADYPTGYNKDNLFVKFFRIKLTETQDWVYSYNKIEIGLQNDGIYVLVTIDPNSGVRLSCPIEIYLEELNID